MQYGVLFNSKCIFDGSLNQLIELKQALVTEWHRLSQTFINKSINEWQKRLQAVVRNNGAHVEHLFN